MRIRLLFDNDPSCGVGELDGVWMASALDEFTEDVWGGETPDFYKDALEGCQNPREMVVTISDDAVAALYRTPEVSVTILDSGEPT